MLIKEKITQWKKSKFSVRDELMLVIMSINIITLLLAAILFTFFQIREMRQNMVDNLNTLAQIIGGNTHAALAFDDPVDADQILADLKYKTDISNAIIYSANGEFFASYSRGEADQAVTLSIAPQEDSYEFKDKQLHIYHVINDSSGKLGSIFLDASLNVLYTQIQQNIKVTIVIIMIALLICYFLTMRLQRIISLPILSLSEAMNRIRETKDYDIRVARDDYVEIEQLSSGFNAMLDQIQNTQKELTESEERLKYALLASNEGTFDWKVKPDILVRNDTYFEMLGYEIDELPDRTSIFKDLIHPDDRADYLIEVNSLLNGKVNELRSVFRVKKKNGNYCWILSKSLVVEKTRSGTPARIVGTQTDITIEKQHEEHLKQLASYDPLTDLPNRKYFTDLLEGAILRGKRKKQSHAVLFMDLDRFKNVNDSLGHTAGDTLLKIVADRLLDIVRGNDVVARLGGDEYTILLEDIPNAHKAAEVSQRIIEALSKPFDLQGHRIMSSPSIGIVIYPDHGTTPEELLKNADAAMYHAKNMGGNNYWYFTEAMNNAAHKRLEMEEALHNALIKNEFILHYQPKINTKTGKLVGMEALVRWKRNGDGLVPPNEFIPLAEETGLIIPIGNQIIRTAIQQTKLWANDISTKNKVAINISPKQFRQAEFLDHIKYALDEFDLPPEYLEIEITEAAVMENTNEAIATMRKIKDYGITLTMDDFGTGYSSLSYLKEFPIDCLKIDQSFIKDMQESDVNKNIVDTIIGLAHNLNLEVVAEGVETTEQVSLLTDLGCDTLQGFYFSKPIPPNQMKELLINGKSFYS